MTNKEAAKHINNFLNGPEYETPRREEIEAMAYAVDVLAKSNMQKPVVIIRPCLALDADQYNDLIKYLKEGYEKGLMIVPNYCEIKVVGNADGVEVRHD